MTGVKQAAIVCALAITCALFATSVRAQSASDSPHVGLGLAFSDVSDLATVLSEDSISSVLVPGVLVPIDVNSHFRLEPEIGGYRNSTTVTPSPNSPVGLPPTTRTFSFLHAGTGAFWTTNKDRVTVYYGGRAAYLRYTQSASGSSSFTYPTIPGRMFAPAVGAEFLLSDHFRVGGEVQVRFISWETSSSSLTPIFSSAITSNSVSTHGSLNVRLYF